MEEKRKTVLATVDVQADIEQLIKLTDLRTKIDGWIAKYGATAALDIQVTGYDGYLGAEIQFERPENDVELLAREKELEKNAAAKLATEQNKMVQLKKLAKELGVALPLPVAQKSVKKKLA